MRKLMAFILVGSVFSGNCWAQITSPLELAISSGSEFFVGRDQGVPLITVNLLNGVTRPGVYHIPTQTSLPQLLAYAGGSLTTADTSDIRVRRVDHQKSLFVRHDLTEIMDENQPFPMMSDKDVVQIKERNNLDSTLRWVAVASGIATTLLSIVIITQYQRNK